MSLQINIFIIHQDIFIFKKSFYIEAYLGIDTDGKPLMPAIKKEDKDIKN